MARTALDALPGAQLGADGRWRRVEEPARDPVALVVRSLPPPSPIMAIGAAATTGGQAVPIVSGLAPPRGPGATAPGRPLPELLARLAPEIDGAPVLVFRADGSHGLLCAALRDAGRDETPGPAVAVAPGLRRAGLLPPRGDLADAAAALGLPAPESEEPGDHAVALAAVWIRARERGVTFKPPPPRPGFDYDRVGFGPGRIDEIPERPGVYRFRDREGKLLYVGKAADLRARIRSYFGHRTKRRKRHAEIMERLWRIEWEETGSELEALLLETREIRERSPEYNVQVGVRRRRPVAGDLVLFLPGSVEGRVELLFLCGGRPAGRLEVDRTKPAEKAIRRALRAALDPASPPVEDEAGAQIVTSWLRSKGDGVNGLDLSEAGSVADAVGKIGECLADPELLSAKFFR